MVSNRVEPLRSNLQAGSSLERVSGTKKRLTVGGQMKNVITPNYRVPFLSARFQRTVNDWKRAKGKHKHKGKLIIINCYISKNKIFIFKSSEWNRINYQNLIMTGFRQQRLQRSFLYLSKNSGHCSWWRALFPLRSSLPASPGPQLDSTPNQVPWTLPRRLLTSWPLPT